MACTLVIRRISTWYAHEISVLFVGRSDLIWVSTASPLKSVYIVWAGALNIHICI